MDNLDVVRQLGYAPLVLLNEGNGLFFGNESFSISQMFQILAEGIIDKTTLQLIQVEDLHRAVDHTETTLGSETLFRSLIQPPTSLEVILDKQEGVRELESDGRLRNAIDDYLSEVSRIEQYIFEFLGNELPYDRGEDHTLMLVYKDFRRSMRAVRRITEAAREIPEPKSNYLRSLVQLIKDFEGSEVYHLAKGPLYRTFHGLRSKKSVGFFTPHWRFYPRRITPFSSMFYAPLVAMFTGAIERVPHPSDERVMFTTMGITIPTMVTVLYQGLMKPVLDYPSAIIPLRKQVVRDLNFCSTMDAVGLIDELRSFSKYAESMPVDTTIPVVTDEGVHYFTATNMRNPIGAKNNPDFVPNDVDLRGKKLTVITGPNSGGKTTYCKSIAQNQLLGQIGCYVVASSASMGVADRIAYQAPQFDVLQDVEGRFGTELVRTRDIFYSTTPRSLRILDELAEGTTIEEKMERSYIIIDGFYTIGNNTVLVTHNHALAGRLQQEGRGQYLQVEFSGQDPTFRVIDGISQVSHAERVAERLGFSAAHIRDHLVRKGYIK